MISGDSKPSRARRLVRAEARFTHFGNLQTKFTMPLETSFCDFAKKNKNTKWIYKALGDALTLTSKNQAGPLVWRC
jgi:hypothetical protein